MTELKKDPLYKIGVREGYYVPEGEKYYDRSSFWYVDGPGMGGYYGGLQDGRPHIGRTAYDPVVTREKLIELLDIAYRRGFDDGQQDIRAALKTTLGL